jgi:hypothetical protein
MGGGAKAIVGAVAGAVIGGPVGAMIGFSGGSALDSIGEMKDAANAQASVQTTNIDQAKADLKTQEQQAFTDQLKMAVAIRDATAGLQTQISNQNAALTLYQNQMNNLMNSQAAKEPEVLSQPGVGAGGRRSGIAQSGGAGGAGGAGGTMLTGPMGVDPSQLTLGRTTLLGG